MIGVLPEHWIAVRLTDVCEINPRSKPELKLQDEVSFVPMAAVSDEFGAIVAPETRTLESVQKGFTPFREGDVLFAKITPCMENGKAAIARELANQTGYGSTEFHVLRPSDLVLAEWLFAIVRTAEFRRAAASAFQGAVGQQRVPASFLEGFRIPLAPLSEQQRIVEILQEAEAIRRLRTEAEAKSAELVPALFQEEFGDPVRNPSTWQLVPFAAVVNGTPKNGLYKPAALYGDGTPIIRIGDFSGGVLRDSATLERVRISDAETEQFGVSEGQILINRVNSIEHLGKSLLVKSLVEPTVYESNMMRLDPNREKVYPEYLSALLQHPSIIGKLRAKAKKAINQASINQGDVLTLTVPVPPPPTQAHFVARLVEFELLRLHSEAAWRSGQALSSSLSAHAFSGQLTASWRDANADKLAAEARQRDAALEGNKTASIVTGSASLTAKLSLLVSGTLSFRTDGQFSDLNREQQVVYRSIRLLAAKEDGNRYFTAESLSHSLDGPLRRNPQAIEGHLAVLAARGLVIPLSLEEQAEDTGAFVFGNAYRLPRGEDDSAGQPSDQARGRELERLAALLEQDRDGS